MEKAGCAISVIPPWSRPATNRPMWLRYLQQIFLPITWLIVGPCAVYGDGPVEVEPTTTTVREDIVRQDVGPPMDSAELNQRVRGLLSGRCFQCHGPDANSREGGFRLDERDSYLSPADSGQPPIVPGDPAAGTLWQRVTSDIPSDRMPPPQHGNGLDSDELALISAWIELGAELPSHWSFVAPIRPAPPDVALSVDQVSSWSHPIDRFVLAEQLQRGFRPSPEAQRSELLRRVSLDLIGLPPTPEEVQAFQSDASPEAYQRQVDRLLASPEFGEHWARQWLDLARYADSAGYADDPDRTIWAYRDWVIRAFNDNLPFNQFTIEQIAGDLLPDRSEDQLVATAFHRNTLTNSEGGTNDEEFRNVAVVDRVNTTMAVWMGVTMACAQCHTHKYDPFTHQEYFQLFAIFNQTQDADRKDESPTIPLFSESQRQMIENWEYQVCLKEMELHQAASVTARLAQFARLEGDAAPDHPELVCLDYQMDSDSNAFAKMLEAEPGQRPDAITRYFTGWYVDSKLLVFRELKGLRKQLDTLEPLTTVPIMSDLSSEEQRTTRVHLRGDYKALGELVQAGVPKVFHPIELPSERHSPTRLELANWLVDQRNPLTARVAVNRIWESLFGNGIVRTSEDLGVQGDTPSHPLLLDWLATEMVALDWDFKALLRQLVTSQTYRQTSRVSLEDLDADRDNIWLARGPRVRLTAEMIRDTVLRTSGLLTHSMYGPPVLPPQPNQGLRAAFGSATDWTPSEGQDRYRRGIYTKWRRSNPYPSMGTFDAPSREVCVLRRDSTNTPLQALVTLNDPAFVEAAQALARRIILYDRPESTDPERMEWAFLSCTSRSPEPKELQALLKLLDQSRDHFSEHPSSAEQFATDPLGPLPSQADSTDLAAWTAVCNVLLNLDEVLMKR